MTEYVDAGATELRVGVVPAQPLPIGPFEVVCRQARWFSQCLCGVGEVERALGTTRTAGAPERVAHDRPDAPTEQE